LALELVLESRDDAPVNQRLNCASSAFQLELVALDEGFGLALCLREAHVAEAVRDVEADVLVAIVVLVAAVDAHHW
jgi:hypothetical protein